MDKTSQVWIEASYDVGAEHDVGRRVRDALDELHVALSEDGYGLKFSITRRGAAFGNLVGTAGAPPSQVPAIEKTIEDVNLDRDQGPAGRRVRELMERNNQEVMARRHLDRLLDRQKIMVEALLDMIMKERE